MSGRMTLEKLTDIARLFRAGLKMKILNNGQVEVYNDKYTITVRERKKMTNEEVKSLLPPELIYPLPDGVIDNLIDIHTMMVIFDLQEEEDVDSKKMDCELLAALIELKERRERESNE